MSTQQEILNYIRANYIGVEEGARNMGGVKRSLTAEERRAISANAQASEKILSGQLWIIDPQDEDFKRLNSIRNKHKAIWRDITLPYDKGLRLVKRPDLPILMDEHASLCAQMDQAKAKFEERWPEIKERGVEMCGEWADANKYPVGWNDTWQLYIRPVEVFSPPEALRHIDAAMYEATQHKFDLQLQAAVSQAQSEFLAEFQKLVGKLVSNLNAYTPDGSKRIQRCHVNNLKDFIDEVRYFNITNDPSFTSVLDCMEDVVDGADHDKLKNDALFRNDVANQLSEASETISTMIETTYGRPVSFE